MAASARKRQYESLYYKNNPQLYDTMEKRRYYTRNYLASKSQNLRRILQPTIQEFVETRRNDNSTVSVVDLGCGPGTAAITVASLLVEEAAGKKKKLKVEVKGVDQLDWDWANPEFHRIRQDISTLDVKFETSTIENFVKDNANKKEKFNIVLLNYVGFKKNPKSGELDFKTVINQVTQLIEGEGDIVLVNDNNIKDVKVLAEYGFEQVSLQHLTDGKTGTKSQDSILLKFTRHARSTTLGDHVLRGQLDGSPRPGAGNGAAKKPRFN